MVLKTHTLNFTKMHGAGNDFVVIDNQNASLTKQQIIDLTPKMCDRHFGVGADGLLALQPTELDTVDFTMLYRNADGSDAGMCGNGARCLAQFASQHGFKSPLTFNVHKKNYRASVLPKNQVQIHFPMQVQIEEETVEDTSLLQLYTGTEHVVTQLPARQLEDDEFIFELGQKLRNNNHFNPPGTNVNFIHGNAKNTLRLRTYEKGVEDITLACGTGAIAAALGWHHLQEQSEKEHYSTIIQADGGNLQIGFEFDANNQSYHNITLKGEAQNVFEGTFKVELDF